jgi:hypothetical protein
MGLVDFSWSENSVMITLLWIFSIAAVYVHCERESSICLSIKIWKFSTMVTLAIFPGG